MENLLTGFRILADYAIASGSQPEVIFRIGKNDTYSSAGHIFFYYIQLMADKRRLLRICHQSTPSDGSQPDIIEIVAQQRVYFITRQVVGRTPRLIVNESSGFVVLHDAQPRTRTHPQGMGIQVFHNIIHDIVRKCSIIACFMGIASIGDLFHILRMVQQEQSTIPTTDPHTFVGILINNVCRITFVY